MKKILFFLILVLMLIALSGCTKVVIESDLNYPVSLSGTNRDYEVVRTFDKEYRMWYTAGGLVTINDLYIDYELDRLVKTYEGDAVIDLVITDEYSIVDYGINLGVNLAGFLLGYSMGTTAASSASLGSSMSTITGFLIKTRTVKLKGKVIRYQ